MIAVNVAAGLFLALMPQSEKMNRLQAIRQGLTNDRPPGVDLYWLLICALALAGLLMLLGLIAKRAERRPWLGKPERNLFTEAVEKLGLARSEANDLRALVAHCRLAEPASLLLSPANYTHALRAAVKNGLDAARRDRLCNLAMPLFGERIDPNTVL